MNSSYAQWRQNISQHFEGRWESILPSIVSDERIPKLFSQKSNVTCPVCDRKSKFYMRDTTTGRSLCCHSDCNTCAFDGIALAKLLGGFNSEVDICKLLTEMYPEELAQYSKPTKPSPTKGHRFNTKPSLVQKQKNDEPPKLNEKALKKQKSLLSEIIPIDDEKAELALKYVDSRGLDSKKLLPRMKNVLFFHPKL